MTTYCGDNLVKWFTFAFLACQVLSAPRTPATDGEIKQLFSESKRDVLAAGPATVPLLRSPLFNPYMMYTPFIPGKPIFYPPFLPVTPSDALLNRLGKSVTPTSATSKPTLDASDPSLMSAYFKAKKDEFLTKLYEKITNGTATSGAVKRAATPDITPEPTKPALDTSFFLKKKYEFLETLFKTLNVTPTPPDNSTNISNANATTEPSTPKPTIVSPDFWFPFAKLPKPTKAPKPTKPPKAKKILKDALDTILLQSLLIDMGVDPKEASLNKRAVSVAGSLTSKKSKTKKVKFEDEPSEFSTAPKDPTLCTVRASVCLDQFFKILNKTENTDLDSYIKPKPKAAPVDLWKSPSEADYIKLEGFLDFLIKSLNATEYPSEKPEKPSKSSKSKFGKKLKKRSTFLDELLHRVTPSPSTTTTPEPTLPPEDIILPEEPECDIIEFLKECCGCGGKCLDEVKKSGEKSVRSLIFKPFGSGYWIPQYLYAAKMGMYLDKLMDTINTEAVNEVESETSDLVKRSSDPYVDSSGLPKKEAALNLIIAELTSLKNNIVDAFADGIQAQKDSTPTQKPFGPSSKSFKKPFWGSKLLPTVDPVAPIQKRLDILNDIFDKLTTVEKTLIFTSEPEYDPKLLTNLTEILEMKSKTSQASRPTPPADSNSPEYILTKAREYLKAMYGKEDESE